MVKFCHKLPNKKDTRKAIPGVGKSELFYPCMLLNYKKSMKAQLVSNDRKQFEAAGETMRKLNWKFIIYWRRTHWSVALVGLDRKYYEKVLKNYQSGFYFLDKRKTLFFNDLEILKVCRLTH